VRVPRLDISATEIRQRVANNQPIRYWVPDPVAACILGRGLYLKDA
jgi:nicotinate-nucleotide adenylyltransferase